MKNPLFFFVIMPDTDDSITLKFDEGTGKCVLVTSLSQFPYLFSQR